MEHMWQTTSLQQHTRVCTGPANPVSYTREAKEMKAQGNALAILPWKLSWLQFQVSLDDV